MSRHTFARTLQSIGAIGLVAALIVGIGGFLLASRVSDAATDTLGPFVDVTSDLADTIDATGVMVERTTEAITSIENTTRSAGRALNSASTALAETSDLVGGDIADSLDSAVDTLPGLISTAAVIDTTMRALSFVGVDYDPELPLDESLAALEASLRPIPDQIRIQSQSLATVTDDIDQIVADSGELAAVLLQTRVDMLGAQDILDSASSNARSAVDQMRAIESDVDTYDTLIRVVFVAAALALAVASIAPILIGQRYGGSEGDRSVA